MNNGISNTQAINKTNPAAPQQHQENMPEIADHLLLQMDDFSAEPRRQSGDSAPDECGEAFETIALVKIIGKLSGRIGHSVQTHV
jgi:hypothetical protein